MVEKTISFLAKVENTDRAEKDGRMRIRDHKGELIFLVGEKVMPILGTLKERNGEKFVDGILIEHGTARRPVLKQDIPVCFLQPIDSSVCQYLSGPPDA